MGFPDYTKDFKPINIHIRSVQDTESFVTGKNKAADVQPFTGPDLIFSSNSSDIVFNHKFYTRLRLIDLADSNTTGFSSYSKPDNVENLDGKVVLTINQENTGEKNIWIRSILEKDIPSYLPNTRVGRSDGLSHKINLFGNITDLYVSDKDQKAGKTLVFDKLSGIKNIDAENINVSKNAVLQNTFTRQLVVSNNPDPDTYKTDDWHFIITDNNGKSDPSIDLKNIVLSTNKSIEIDEKNSYRDPSFNILNHGQDVERNPKRKNDIKLNDLEYFEGTARLAQQLESPIHLKVFSNDPTQKGKDGKPLVTIAGEVYLNGPSEATQSTGELPYFNLDLKNSYLFSSIVDNPNKNDEVVTRSKDKETTKEGARQFVTSIHRKKDTSTAIQSDYDYIKFDDITERPSTLDGYGITDATTKDEFNKEVEERKQADEDIRTDVDNGLFKIVADNAINALNKYELLRINIEKLSNLYTNDSFTTDTDILKSDTIGFAVIDEDIHGEFKNTVFKKCTTLKDAVDKVLSDYEKEGALTITRSTESAFVNKRHDSEGTSNVEYSVITDITSSTDKAKQLNAEKLLALNNQIADLLSECEHTQNELFTVLHLDTKRQLQYDIFNREPDPDDYIPGTVRPLIESFFDYTTAEVADDEDLKDEKLLLEFNNKGTDTHVITVESSVDLKGNFMDFDSASQAQDRPTSPNYYYEVIGRSRELFDTRIEVSDVKDYNGRQRTTITISCSTNYNYVDSNWTNFMYDENSEVLKRYNETVNTGHDIRYVTGPNTESYLKLTQVHSGKTLLIPLIVQAPDHLGGIDLSNYQDDEYFYSPNLSDGTTDEEQTLYIYPDGTILESQLSDNRLPDDPIERIPNIIEDMFYDYSGDLIDSDYQNKEAFNKFEKSSLQTNSSTSELDRTAITIISSRYNGDNWEIEKIEDINTMFDQSSYGEDIPPVVKDGNKLRLNLNLSGVQYDRYITDSSKGFEPNHWLSNSISHKLAPILGRNYNKNTYFGISCLNNKDYTLYDPNLGYYNKQIYDSNFVYGFDDPKSGIINSISKFVPPTISSLSGQLINDVTCPLVCRVTLKQRYSDDSGPKIKIAIRCITGMVYKFAHATKPYTVETRTTEQLLKDLNSEEYTPRYINSPEINAPLSAKPLRRKDTKSKPIKDVLNYNIQQRYGYPPTIFPRNGYFDGRRWITNSAYPETNPYDKDSKFVRGQLNTDYSWNGQALSVLPTTAGVKTYDFNASLMSAEGYPLFNALYGRTICGFDVKLPQDNKPFDIIIDLYHDGLKMIPSSVYKNDDVKDLADRIIDYNKLDLIFNYSGKQDGDSSGIINFVPNKKEDKDKLRDTIITNVINKYKEAKFYYDFRSIDHDDSLTNTKSVSYETVAAPVTKEIPEQMYSKVPHWKPYMELPVIKRLRDRDEIDSDMVESDKSDDISGISVRYFVNGYNETTKKYEFIDDGDLRDLNRSTHLICVITVDPSKLTAKKFTQTIDGKESVKTFCGFKLCLLAQPEGFMNQNEYNAFATGNKEAFRNRPGFEFYFSGISLFDAEPKELNFRSAGGSADVNVTSLQGSRNLDWDIKNESELPDWLTVSKQADKIHVEAKPSE